MSEHPNFSKFHAKGERQVKNAITHGGDAYEISGRESDPEVAEAMAYAAKPLIDEALEKMETLEPNGVGVWKDSEGRSRGPTVVPGVVFEDHAGKQRTITYGQLENKVLAGHGAASEIQEKYYDDLAEATRIAKELRDKAKTSL